MPHPLLPHHVLFPSQQHRTFVQTVLVSKTLNTIFRYSLRSQIRRVIRLLIVFSPNVLQRVTNLLNWVRHSNFPT